jgi:hypothetical protein
MASGLVWTDTNHDYQIWLPTPSINLHPSNSSDGRIIDFTKEETLFCKIN